MLPMMTLAHDGDTSRNHPSRVQERELLFSGVDELLLPDRIMNIFM